jgi:hypothetical protein
MMQQMCQSEVRLGHASKEFVASTCPAGFASTCIFFRRLLKMSHFQIALIISSTPGRCE